MVLVFDLGGPLLAYSLLRSAGLSAVAALVISGVLPALGIVIGALADRRLDVIGVVVMAGIVVGTVLGLTSHNARLYLLEEIGRASCRERKWVAEGAVSVTT